MQMRDEYLARANGAIVEAGILLALDLMRGDATTFKAGYTAEENAAYAAADVFAEGDPAYRAEVLEGLRDS